MELTMEQLFLLGLASGMARKCLPSHLWKPLPRGNALLPNPPRAEGKRGCR